MTRLFAPMVAPLAPRDAEEDKQRQVGRKREERREQAEERKPDEIERLASTYLGEPREQVKLAAQVMKQADHRRRQMI
jgi:hypothetical protein